MKRLVVVIVLFLIRMYQLMVRPHLVGSCKFVPTCSDYAAEAVVAHGVWRGAGLAMRRVCRCCPWGRGGWDPVPGAN